MLDWFLYFSIKYALKARKRNSATGRRTMRLRRQGGTTPPKELGWFTMEEPIEDGRPQFPKGVAESVARVRYDPDVHTDLRLHIRTGAGPEGQIIGQYKMYAISKCDMQGRRKTALATVHLPADRVHEKDWFEAFRGTRVEVRDPGIAGSISTTYRMRVHRVRFDRAISTRDRAGYRFEASLTMSEPILAFLWRQKGRVAIWVTAVLVTSAIGSLIAQLLK